MIMNSYTTPLTIMNIYAVPLTIMTQMDYATDRADSDNL